LLAHRVVQQAAGGQKSGHTVADGDQVWRQGGDVKTPGVRRGLQCLVGRFDDVADRVDQQADQSTARTPRR